MLVRDINEAGVVVIEARGRKINARSESIGGLIKYIKNLGKDMDRY